MKHFIGVDVGTGSVRAALVQSDGRIVSTATKAIQIWNPQPDFYQQSTVDIWAAVIHTVKSVLADGGVDRGSVAGLGFDATCSLVVMDTDGQPLSVCPTGNPDCDIIMWMDHRASAEANVINATKHRVLTFTGGAISLEMEPPKLLWLKKNLGEQCWSRAGHFFDLCDFLTWRATGSKTRSLCSVISKWTYVADGSGSGGFSEDFYTQIGLGDLCESNFAKIGDEIRAQGEPCGGGLSARAAGELGLAPGTAVGIGMIDAHCGTVGCLGCRPHDSGTEIPPIESRLAMISGTSTCHMAISTRQIFVLGVWGPNWSSIVPGYWSAEGGQSAAGKLIDFVIENHSCYQQALDKAQETQQHIHEYLYSVLEAQAKTDNLSNVAQLTKEFHLWPDFHGNRSPVADHTLKGMVCGLTLRSDVVDLAILYLAAVQALAYGTKHIVSAMLESGHTTSILYICGGLRKNPLYIQTHADVSGLPVIVPDEEESVLLGAAILGATASGLYSSIPGFTPNDESILTGIHTRNEGMENMCGKGKVTLPDPHVARYHAKKYDVFLKMLDDQRQYKAIMEQQWCM